MTVKIKKLDKKDFAQARQFAIEGMNLKRYTNHPLELKLYSLYFWYAELLQATRSLGAYDENGRLLGVLLVKLEGEKPCYSSIWAKAFVRSFEKLLNLSGRSSEYDKANQAMIAAYQAKRKVDGQINFFAVDSQSKGQGVGSLLLRHLETTAQGKHIYLYTDSGCTYQFYEARGFQYVEKRKIQLETAGQAQSLTCMLFSKTLSK